MPVALESTLYAQTMSSILLSPESTVKFNATTFGGAPTHFNHRVPTHPTHFVLATQSRLSIHGGLALPLLLPLHVSASDGR